jgi:hypothetical protein
MLQKTFNNICRDSSKRVVFLLVLPSFCAPGENSQRKCTTKCVSIVLCLIEHSARDCSLQSLDTYSEVQLSKGSLEVRTCKSFVQYPVGDLISATIKNLFHRRSFRQQLPYRLHCNTMLLTLPLCEYSRSSNY